MAAGCYKYMYFPWIYESLSWESLFFLDARIARYNEFIKGIGRRSVRRVPLSESSRLPRTLSRFFFVERQVLLSFDANSTPIRSFVGRSRRTHLSSFYFSIFLFSNVADTDVYVKYCCKEYGAKICWSRRISNPSYQLDRLEYQLADLVTESWLAYEPLA